MREPARGERAIRARQKAARLAAEKPESSSEADAKLRDDIIARANRDAEIASKLPEDLVKSCGEVIQQDFRLAHIVDTLQNPTMINITASEYRLDLAACVGGRVAELAVDAAESAQAANSLEKMLCHQMAAAHCAAMKLTARSLDSSLPPVEMARLTNAAARMMQVYQEALLTLQRIRTGGKQTVVVQHVQVSDGGQAVIAGNMKSGEGA